MGAIALSRMADPSASAPRVRRMLAAAPHRGQHHHVAVAGSTAVGISAGPRRDAWLDTNDSMVAAVMGSLDNADQLRRELELGDVSPAGVVLSAWRAWGEGALERFRGSFAGVVADGTTVSCFRDHFGFRPLYYSGQGDSTLVATECKQINAARAGGAEPDLDAVTRNFFGNVEVDETVFRGVQRVPRASVLTIGPDGKRLRRYWDPSPLLETCTLRPDEILERLTGLLVQAVTRTLTGDDVILLSGGVDSPTVAALAARPHLEMAGRRLKALSAVYPDHPSVDESAYIKIVSDHLDLDLHTFVTGVTPYDDTQHWVDVLDGPISTVAIPVVADAYGRAAALGGGTVLTGEIEEYVFEVNAYLLDHLVAHRKWSAVARHVAQLRRKGRRWHGIGRSLVRPLVPPRAAAAYARRSRETLPAAPSWIDRSLLHPLGVYADLARPAGQRWSALQLKPLRGGVNSFETDELCAAVCGVDVRRPFADIDLWSFLLSLPAERKWPELRTKAFLRTVMRGHVPEAVLERRDKTYFDEAALDAVDYPSLRKWIFGRGERIAGVDYAALERRLDLENLSFAEVQWATDLMYVHAFIDRWS